MKSLFLKISNLFWVLGHFAFNYKKKIHYLFFTPLYGFFPWVFRKNRFDLFLVSLPLDRTEILFYLTKNSQSILVNWEIRQSGLIVDFGNFKEPIKRRKYKITLIRTKATTQMSLSSSNVLETVQSEIVSDFNFSFIYGKRVLERSFKGPIIHESIR